MPQWVRTTLKWTVALAGMGLIVMVAGPRALEELTQAVSFDMNGEDTTPGVALTPTDDPQTTGGATPATFVASAQDGIVVAVGPETVTLGDEADEVLLAFEAAPIDPACITEARLEVTVADASGAPEVRVQPARLADLGTLSDGEPLPADVAIDAEDAAAASLGEGEETLTWIVTAVYSIAAREAPADAHVVLSLGLTQASEGSIAVLTAAGDAEQAATLSWTAVEGCPEGAAPQDA